MATQVTSGEPQLAADPYFQSLFAARIGGASYGKGTEIYKFEKIKRAKRKALADFPDRQLIDFGIGENDSMADALVRDELARQVHLPSNRGYADNGIAAYKEAVSRFMERRFGVQLDPASEVNHCIGSKTALSMLPACLIDPGDITLMTVPGYPVAGTHTKYYGGSVHSLPLHAENDFFPDFDAISDETWRRVKLLVINYPNSPTGKTATVEFYQRVIQLALQHQFVVVQDAAHIMLSYDGPALSFLSVPGAKEVGVEVHSMSKGFDMIGWRIGWVCGHPRLVSALADVKDNCDSGQFMAIQHAAATALDNDQIADRVREKYRRRLTKLVRTLRDCGFDCQMPGGTYFLYTRAPRAAANVEFETAEQVSQHLITQQSMVTVPWNEAGQFLRFSVTYEAADEAAEDALMAETARRLKSLQLQF
ncbi:MAG: LL-diaminopimelate aminotransferase [Pirellulaceae bacterium]|nr:LL-diaminopimelate aminotransferase [Pirellulaceae bacterium]